MSLLAQQKNFADLMVTRGKPATDLYSKKITVARGLAVYRNNIRGAWRNALAATFPVLTQLLGEDGFSLCAQDYCAAHPSQSGDLNELGVHFAEFLAQYAPLSEYPYLPDVARLEWLWHRAHYAADAAPLSVADLMAHGADDWLAARVQAAPSAFVLSCGTAAATIWLAHQEGGDVAALADDAVVMRPEHCLVSRPRWRVEVRVMDEATVVFLELLQSGLCFEAALAALEAQDLAIDLVAVLPILLEAGVWQGLVW